MPIWTHPFFLGVFGDAFIEGTGLEGGDLSASISAMNLLLERALADPTSSSSPLSILPFSQSDLQAMNVLSQVEWSRFFFPVTCFTCSCDTFSPYRFSMT